MRNPLGLGALTEEDKKELEALTDHIIDTYMDDINLTVGTITMLIRAGMPILSIVATLIAAGYALKMYEMKQLEDNLFKNVENK